MKRLFVGLALLSASCGMPAQYRQDGVDELYPPDCHRLDILEARGAPYKSYPVSERHQDPFAAGSIRVIEADSGAVVAYWDYYLTLRGGWGSSLGAFGLFGDYLFYTKDDVLITARRRFLD